MMSYAPGSSVGTTSTSVPECGKETPDRVAVCTLERTVTHKLPLTGAQQDHNNHRVHSGEEQEQNQMGGSTRTTRITGGRGESPTQHR